MTPEETTLHDALKAARRNGMNAADDVLRGCGVESVRNECSGRSIRYVNLGDTYETTVCTDGRRYWLGSWGSWLEAEEMRLARSGWFRCPNCGEYTQRCRRRRMNCDSCDYQIID